MGLLVCSTDVDSEGMGCRRLHPQLTAQFLTERERAIVIGRLENDTNGGDHEPFSWSGVAAAIKDPIVWGYGLLFHAFAFTLCASVMRLTSLTCSHTRFRSSFPLSYAAGPSALDLTTRRSLSLATRPRMRSFSPFRSST